MNEKEGQLPQAEMTENSVLRFPAATRVKLHAAVDAAFDEMGEDKDVNVLRQKLNEKLEKVLLGQNDEVLQGAIDSVREQLMHPMKAGSDLADLHFADDVLAKLVEISRQHRLPRERSTLAVLAALLEAIEPQTPETLSQRTGYAVGRMVGMIRSLNNIWLRETAWTITGKSTTGWRISRS